MTDAIEWLKARAPGFNNLAENEINAITDFSLLWSLLESRIVNRNANATALCTVVEGWHASNMLVPALFDEELAYLRDRYHPGAGFSHHFPDLRLQRSDREPLVKRVLQGTDNDPVHRQCAALIVVYRYRNNLFHGEKWTYGLEDQFGNFTAANAILTKALDRYGNL